MMHDLIALLADKRVKGPLSFLVMRQELFVHADGSKDDFSRKLKVATQPGKDSGLRSYSELA